MISTARKVRKLIGANYLQGKLLGCSNAQKGLNCDTKVTFAECRLGYPMGKLEGANDKR
jgi:hypothetical protein